MSKFVSEKIRQAVRIRANDCCEYCRSQLGFSPDSFSVEHILPIAKGGLSNLQNLAFSCQGCNNKKYVFVSAPDPLNGIYVPLYNPRVDEWDEHFQWSFDFSLLIGLTPTGRATIERLELNREGVMNLRKVLFKNKKHPPQF